MPVAGDNVQLNLGAGGDLSRAIDRTGTGTKAQVAVLDLGGAGVGNENLALPTQLLAFLPQFLMTLVKALNSQQATEINGGRLRVVLDAAPGAQTLGTVTTVTTVTTVSTVTAVNTLAAMGPSGAGIPIRDAHITPLERDAWGMLVRNRIP